MIRDVFRFATIHHLLQISANVNYNCLFYRDKNSFHSRVKLTMIIFKTLEFKFTDAYLSNHNGVGTYYLFTLFVTTFKSIVTIPYTEGLILCHGLCALLKFKLTVQGSE